MTTTATRTIVWVNGEDQFCLSKAGLIFDLEDKCGAGIAVVFNRLRSDCWKLNDVRETIRLGLIGGGRTPVEAMAIVKRHVDDQPLLPLVLVAHAVLEAVMIGVPDDPVGKKKAARRRPPKAEASSTMTDA